MYPDLKDLSGSYITDNDLRFIAMHIGSNLVNFEFEDANVTDRGLSVFCKEYPGLKRFRLECNKEIGDSDEEEEVDDDDKPTDAGVIALIDNCTALEDIALFNWANITDLSMDYLSSITTLTHLKLSGCRKLTTAGVMRVIQANAGLQHIEIANIKQAKTINNFILRIGSTCPGLKTLEVSLTLPLSHKISTKAMISLVRSCPLLEELVLKGFPQTDEYLIALSSSCPLLKSFALTGSVVTDTGLLALTRGCRKLTALILSHVTRITDVGVTGIATDCCNLIFLQVCGNQHITDESLCAVFRACSKLTSVVLDKCSLITDRALVTLAQVRGGLQRLHLGDNTLLTERSITAIVTFPTTLEALYMAHMPVTDDSMMLLARYCTHLKNIDIHHCNLITIRTLKALIENCQCLRTLSVEHCTQLTRTHEVNEYLRSAAIKKIMARGVHVMFT